MDFYMTDTAAVRHSRFRRARFSKRRMGERSATYRFLGMSRMAKIAKYATPSPAPAHQVFLLLHVFVAGSRTSQLS